jgi:hypothetical protein
MLLGFLLRHGRRFPGRMNWKVPFGFRRGDDGELVPHEAEQEAIREMAALRAEGKTLRAILRRRRRRATGSVMRAWRGS